MNDEILPDLGLEVGDKVEGYGLEGEVTSTNHSVAYPIAVKFKNADITRWFFPDGRVETWHKIPLLKLIEKKIKLKSAITLYRYTYASGDYFYKTAWSNDPETCKNINIIKTETKEVESD